MIIDAEFERTSTEVNKNDFNEHMLIKNIKTQDVLSVTFINDDSISLLNSHGKRVEIKYNDFTLNHEIILW